MTKERNPWLDYVRFFSIFLVILYHTPPRHELLDEAVILNLRVPVFFCISGYLFDERRWPRFSDFLRHRGKQILIPYALFFGVFYVLWLWFGRRLQGGIDATMPPARPLIEFVLGCPRTVVAPFWYIVCLLTMQVIYYWLVCLVTRRFSLPVACVLAVAVCALSWRQPWLQFWNLGNALLYMPFYAYGQCLRPWLDRLTFGNARHTALMLLAAVVSVIVMCVAVARLKPVNPGNYALVRIACGMMLIPAYLCVGKWVAARLGRRRVVESAVMGGTIYLGLQNYLIGITRVGLDSLLGIGWMASHAEVRLLVALAVMVAIYPISTAIQRHAPWIIGRKKENTTDNQLHRSS